MLKTSKSISITGQSYIESTTKDNSSTEQIIAYMNASIPDHGDININKSIQNKELFSKHKQAVLDDFAEFETYVYSLS